MLSRCDPPLPAMQPAVAALSKKERKKNAIRAAAAVMGDHDNITMDDEEFTSSHEDNEDTPVVKDDFHGPDFKKSKTEGAPSDSREGATEGSADASAHGAPAPAAAGAGSAAAADAPVFPVLSQFDLFTAIANLTSMVTGIHVEMKAHNQLFSHLDSKITQIEANLDTKMDAKFEAFKTEVNLRMENLSLASSSAAPAATTSTQGSGLAKPPWRNSTGGASSGGPSATTPLRSTAAGSATETSAPTDEVGRKVIAIGFPRTLPRPALLGWWEEQRLRLPLDIQSKGTFQGGTGKAFSVTFPTRADARSFTSTISAGKFEFLWDSPRAEEKPYIINFKTERTVEEKDRGRALSGAWRILDPLIRDSAKFDSSSMKFTTDPRRGSIAVATGKDMWDLVLLKTVDGVLTITTDDTNLKYFGISPEVADSIRTTIAAPPAGQ